MPGRQLRHQGDRRRVGRRHRRGARADGEGDGQHRAAWRDAPSQCRTAQQTRCQGERAQDHDGDSLPRCASHPASPAREEGLHEPGRHGDETDIPCGEALCLHRQGAPAEQRALRAEQAGQGETDDPGRSPDGRVDPEETRAEALLATPALEQGLPRGEVRLRHPQERRVGQRQHHARGRQRQRLRRPRPGPHGQGENVAGRWWTGKTADGAQAE
mmetsp:Transcript_92087/g.288164  ORF Transcript_92087/g.288164 Transcript_92087/m.288164 type:complete len:215 (+) Transcript_92087:234-878(+)